MSYARWADDSDVYVFLNVSGYYECCACPFNAPSPDGSFPDDFRADTTDEIIAHVTAHLDAGHAVPDRCLVGLERDRDDNDTWLDSERSAPDEKQDS